MLSTHATSTATKPTIDGDLLTSNGHRHRTPTATPTESLTLSTNKKVETLFLAASKVYRLRSTNRTAHAAPYAAHAALHANAPPNSCSAAHPLSECTL